MADFTLGIEEEFQIIDPVTRDLKAHITEMIEEGQMILGEQVKPEMHQSMIEVGTGICANVQEARDDVIRLRRAISELAARKGLRIAAASTHPFSDWEDRGLVGSIASHVEAGYCQVFCVDQVDRESWYGRHLHPAQRAQRHQQYDRYLCDEVVPFTRSLNADPFVVTPHLMPWSWHALQISRKPFLMYGSPPENSMW